MKPYVAFHAALRSAYQMFVAQLEGQSQSLVKHHLDAATTDFALSLTDSCDELKMAKLSLHDPGAENAVPERETGEPYFFTTLSNFLYCGIRILQQIIGRYKRQGRDRWTLCITAFLIELRCHLATPFNGGCRCGSRWQMCAACTIA